MFFIQDTFEFRWKWKLLRCVSLWPHGLYSPWNSPGQNTGVCSLSLLQGIFPTQGLNPGLSHCSRILYQQSQKGSPRILKWVAYPFSSGSFWPRNGTGVSWNAGGFFTNELSEKDSIYECVYLINIYMKMKKWKHYSLSCVWLFVTLWTVALQAPLSMEFSRQEYWSG